VLYFQKIAKEKMEDLQRADRKGRVAHRGDKKHH